VKHWIYINEVVPVKYVEKKTKETKEMKVHWFRWFFLKVEKPVEVWEDAFPWP
jgi:hypothetical protein